MIRKDEISVGKNNIRNYAAAIATLYLDKKTMAKQAKTLNQQELRKVLDYISTRKHSARNRALLMTTFLSGMRVGEVSSLRFKDVVDVDGNIRNEIRLTPEMTKGEFARVVFVNERLRKELARVEVELDNLIADSGEGAGDDQADSGTKTFEREHEMSLVINARDMVLQTERALERIDAKTYGFCEVCGAAIGKPRLQVFPRATLCMICKQKEERR